MIKLILSVLFLSTTLTQHCSFSDDCCIDCERMLVFQASSLTNTSSDVGIDNFVTKLSAEGVNYTEFETMAFNFFQYQFGLDYANANSTPPFPFLWKDIPGVAGLVPFVFNDDESVDYRVRLVGGDDSHKLQCATLKLYLFDVLLWNPAALSGKWRNQIVAPGETPDARYNALFYGVNVLSYYRGPHLVKKYFYACSPIPTIKHQMVANKQFDTVIYVDAESTPRFNWGIGEATVDASFDPAITTEAGQYQDIRIRNTWSFPAIFTLYGIHDKTCIA